MNIKDNTASVFARFNKKNDTNKTAFTISAIFVRLLKPIVNPAYPYQSFCYNINMQDMGEYYKGTNYYDTIELFIPKDNSFISLYISNAKRNFIHLDEFIKAIRDLPFPLNYEVDRAFYDKKSQSAIIELFRL